MSRKTRTILIVAFAIICAALAFGWSYKFPKTIDASYEAIEFRDGDAASAGKTAVTIQGTLYKPLFREEYFRGKITVEGYDYTDSYDLSQVTFDKDINNGEGYLVYDTVSNGRPILRTFGSIWKEGGFDRLRISVFEPVEGSSKSAKGLTIAAPATDYEEAQAIADKAAVQ
ncbi:hypothetical protein [Cohnella thailandensis]|uniref:Uncharacterized protein n=1 Tax=Cohnella thailandensis TaxID=557557 RepID=A0A841SZH1_9BACL|nr:hypothetical protein [Cohnella thailandensis]MBB6635230.1 hypothetical protein [Cohnella thailandensis]MBP1974302.1 hypothetical protein [Cohnella thailandensis]